MIWVIFACFCKISLQIDSISVLCETDVIFRQYFMVFRKYWLFGHVA
jgi:hypothetical protein